MNSSKCTWCNGVGCVECSGTGRGASVDGHEEYATHLANRVPPAEEVKVEPDGAEAISAEILMLNVGLEAAKKAVVDILDTLEGCKEKDHAVYDMWDAIRFELNKFSEL